MQTRYSSQRSFDTAFQKQNMSNEENPLMSTTAASTAQSSNENKMLKRCQTLPSGGFHNQDFLTNQDRIKQF